MHLKETTPIYYDNYNLIQIAHDNIFYERIKHIKIDCHFIRYHLFLWTSPSQEIDVIYIDKAFIFVPTFHQIIKVKTFMSNKIL
jgi:hypothetical protein